MEERLVPINAMLSLVERDRLIPPVLSNVGFDIVGIEVPVLSTAEDGSRPAVADLVFFHSDALHFLVCEAKSGKNIEAKQATVYKNLNPKSVVDGSRAKIPRRGDLTVEMVYACLAKNADGIVKGLEVVELQAPVIAVGKKSIELLRTEFASQHLRAAFNEGPVTFEGTIPRLIEFDDESPVDALVRPVLSELVAATSRRDGMISYPALTERIARYWPVYGRSARQRLAKKVGQAAARVCEDRPDYFKAVPKTSNGTDGFVRILKTPEDNDARGRTQAYQALARRKKRVQRNLPDPNQLDLLAELEKVDDMVHEEDTVNEVGEVASHDNSKRDD